MKRRDFLARAAAGSAVLTVPGFLAGCGMQQAAAVAEPTPENPFTDWFGIDQATIARVMSELTANGADLADLYFQHTRNNSLSFENGVVSDAQSNISQGVGLRVVVGEQTGYAFTEDLTLPSTLAAARTAAAIASGNATVAPQAFAPQEMGDLYTTTVPWADVGIDQKLPLLKFVEDKAKSMDPTISKVSVHLSDADERVMIATLDGRLVMDHRPMTRMTVLITAQKGEEIQSGFSNIAAREELGWYTEERLTRAVKEAVDRTMLLFDTVRPPTGEMPVILAAGTSGVLLHEAIGHTMEADFNRTGASVYADRIGEKVAESFVSVVDEATIPHERGALNYDDEGVAAGRTVMVENGVLSSYLHDQVSARQYALQPTGSGRRESYKFAPMPRMTCTYMENGPHSREEIIAAVDRGVICETFTTGQVQLAAGDYNFSVKNGWLVEKGKITAPIKDFNIIGSGPELLQRITMVADDQEMDAGGWTCGKNGQGVPVSQGMPTVLVKSASVGARPSARSG